MQGHGQAQPPPSTGLLVFLRVLFVVISVCSFGLLGWVMLLRLALVTRKSLDWGLLVALFAAEALGLVLLGTEPGEEIHTPGGWTGLALLLGSLVPAISYYLAAEIRHFHALAYAHRTYAGGQSPAHAYGYPQPQPQPPYAAATGPHTPVPQMAPMPRPPSSAPIPSSAPTPTPPPQRPAPARIDQVRAELDELSDYLRKHEDGR
ncbi:hypothetical protein [Streptomyces sp. DSM 40484]|uniref:hypothetical protein n=1 Tax=Streptomyces kroppenstedtii TaxID=3051181 RepID=UPI0028D4C30C|nr:hypothetical protein [Streptomyces sp. DSM 40484]